MKPKVSRQSSMDSFLAGIKDKSSTKKASRQSSMDSFLAGIKDGGMRCKSKETHPEKEKSKSKKGGMCGCEKNKGSKYKKRGGYNQSGGSCSECGV